MSVDMVGFRTAEGSIYRWDHDTCSTTRLKMSPGAGKGQWQDACTCLFAREAKFDQARIDHERPGTSIKLGWLTPDGKTLNIMGADNRLDNMDPDGQPVIAWVNNQSNQAVVTLGALTDPEIGFKPVEKFYTDDGKSITHFSNSSIVKIYTDPAEMKQDIDAALRGLTAPAAASPSQQFSHSAGQTLTEAEQRKREAAERIVASGRYKPGDDEHSGPQMSRRWIPSITPRR